MRELPLTKDKAELYGKEYVQHERSEEGTNKDSSELGSKQGEAHNNSPRSDEPSETKGPVDIMSSNEGDQENTNTTNSSEYAVMPQRNEK